MLSAALNVQIGDLTFFKSDFTFLILLLKMFNLAATSFRESQLQYLIPLLEVMPDNIQCGVPYLLSLMTGLTLFLNFKQANLVSYLMCFIGFLCRMHLVARVLLDKERVRQL